MRRFNCLSQTTNKCYCHVINGQKKDANVECETAGISALGDENLISQVNRTKSKLFNILRIGSLILAILLTLVLMAPNFVEATTTKEKLDEARKHLNNLQDRKSVV